jgi:hypothetical protein
VTHNVTSIVHRTTFGKEVSPSRFLGYTRPSANPMRRGWGEGRLGRVNPDPRDAQCHLCSSRDDVWRRSESIPIPETHKPICQSHEKRLGGRLALDESIPIPVTHNVTSIVHRTTFGKESIPIRYTGPSANPTGRGWGKTCLGRVNPDPRDAQCHLHSPPDDVWKEVSPSRFPGYTRPSANPIRRGWGEGSSWTSQS